MFDMSWGEVMVIGAVALIVIGPKDLPKTLRTVGQATAKLRRMASEFQSQFNEAMREAELEEVKKEIAGINQSVSSATSGGFNPIQTIRDELKNAVEAPPPAIPAGPVLEPGASPNPADPTLVPSVDLPVLPLPPLEPGPSLPAPEPGPESQPAAAVASVDAPLPEPTKAASA
jgi:sec-independent protein translocase protein TatB